MRDEQIFDLLAETNPVPDADGLDSLPAFLDFTTGKGAEMQTQQKTTPTIAPLRRRGALVTAAAFLAVVVAGIGIYLATRGGDAGLDVATAREWAVQFGDEVSAGDIGKAADLFSPDWQKLGIPMTEGGWGIVPPGARGDNVSVNGELTDGLEFIAAWMDLDISACSGEVVGESRVTVYCTATTAGPMPQALDLRAFDLPVVFGADEQGIVSFGLDFTAIESPTYQADPDLVPTLTAFNLYSAADSEFFTENQLGIGKPVISADSAAAHLQEAEEWVAAGKP